MNKFKYIILVLLGLSFFSCNEREWLKEEPMDFNTPDNSYETVSNFQQAINYLQDLTRAWHFTYSDETGGYQHHLILGSDVFYHGWPNSLDDNLNRYDTYIIATRNHVAKNWAYFYNIISNANTILEKLETNASEVTDAQKQTFRGEALFFRAYYYMRLAHIWGDVPLVLEMQTSPKIDFVRAPRDQVYAQCQADLEEAVGLLANIENVDNGAINKQLAQHVLAEVYISRKNFDAAISAANAVVNHPAVALMTERFGSYKDDATKNVFFDLFRQGNQNRTAGNTEGLWVLQYDYLNPGSAVTTNWGRYIMPQLRTAQVMGKNGQLVLACPDFTAEDGGRGNGYFPTTHHFREEIWASDYDNDIRNAECNIFRDYRIDNENAEGWGQWIVKDGWIRDVDTFNFVYPAVTKFCAFEAYPDNSYALANGVRRVTSLGKQMLVNSGTAAVGSFKDEYRVRLSETYLLLAEAYVGANQPENAAAAINVVRSRAKASPATAAEMNLDYVLDERIRELAGEEVRNITLFRLGKFVERAKRYNPAGNHVAAHQDLWPIPFSEIEKNTAAELTQNPGY
ncbi:MAG: RagB/SusD family nutrient uptake outer membrane protein [Tannerella sp.]|jgi:hypothetical protein|nr:RagB/SusD family nutrient uptake outer membrane protein [Tannerella sp.]